MTEEKKEFKRRSRVLSKLGEIKLEPGIKVDDVIFFNGRRNIQVEEIGDNSYRILGEKNNDN